MLSNFNKKCLLFSNVLGESRFKHTVPVSGDDFELQYLKEEQEGDVEECECSIYKCPWKVEPLDVYGVIQTININCAYIQQ